MSSIVQELLSRASDEAGIGWTPTTIIPVPARLLHHAAARIEQLEAALREIGSPPDHFTINDAVAKARAVLKERT